MLDPFIGFCKEGKLTVEHTPPYLGAQPEPTAVNIWGVYIIAVVNLPHSGAEVSAVFVSVEKNGNERRRRGTRGQA